MKKGLFNKNRRNGHYKLFVVFFAFLISVFFSTKVSALNIKATNISVADKSSTAVVDTPVMINGEISSNITFNEVNDYAIFNLTITNNESDKYKIESITDNNTNNNITVNYDYSKDYFKGENKIKIKLLYKNKLVNQEKINLNNLNITINLVNDKGESKDIIINPITGDNILMYIIFLILALTGLVFTLKKTRVKGIKIGSIVILISMFLLPFAIFALERYEVKIRFTDIEIKGEFEKYNITINPGNGSTPIIKEVTYGEKIGELPADPSKEGYEFEKWVDNKGNEVTEDTVVTGPISVEAKYKVVEYTISYDLDGGTVIGNPDKYTIESNNITLKNPTKEGYTFTGWTGTGIDTKTTSVTIEKGSIGNRNYTAHYSAQTDTAYKVKHRYQKLDSGYEEEVVTEYGETGKEVDAPIKSKTGFVNPSVQRVTIKADGTSEVIYNYDREIYAFSISDRTYIDSVSTADGNYPYETKITVKAQERAGYDFVWSDGETDLEREFNITEPTSISPIYTAKTNTAYKVVHQKQKITLDGYEVANTQILTGTTDSSITPEVKTYEGFTSPSTQTTTIKGDGTTVVTYNYDRIMYDFSTNENVISSKPSGSHPYGTEIELTAKEKQGYTFSKWSNDETDNPLTITLDSNLTIEPVYEANELIFNGDDTISKVYSTSSQTVTITGASNGTGSYTYTEVSEKKDNVDTDYITINNTTITLSSGIPAGVYTYIVKATDTNSGSEKNATFVVTITKQKSDTVTNINVTPEGIVSFTNSSNADGYLISIDGINYTPVVPGEGTTSVNYLNEITGNSGNRTIYVKATNSDGDNYEESDPVTVDVTVYTLNSSVNNDEYGTVSTSSLNVINGVAYTTTDTTLTLSDARTITTSKKDITGYTTTFTGWSSNSGTISQNTNIIANYTRTINEYTITFDTDGGSEVVDQIVEYGGYATRPTTDPTKDGYTFDDWYTNDSYEIKYNFSTPITGNKTIYGKYLKDISSATITPASISINIGDEETISVTDVEEEYTFTSSDTGVATVDNNGKVTGVSEGNATITITGSTSNKTRTVNVTIKGRYTVTFNSNGGGEVSSITVDAGESIQSFTTPTAPSGKLFDGWYTDLESGSKVNTPYTPEGNITLYAHWNNNSFPEVFSEPGECTFNGSNGVLTGDNCSYANGTNKYIDTGINLYNHENHDKDYEIGFTIVSYNPSEQVKQATFMNTKLEGNNYPGLVFRRRDNYDNLDFSSRKTSSTNERKFLDYTDGMKVKIYRITNTETGVQEIFYSINDEEKIKINDLSQFNPEFDLSVWFGAAPTNASSTAAQRILVNTTLKDMYIKLGTY